GPPNCTYCFPTPDGNGSVSEFSASGTPISGPNGYQGGPVRDWRLPLRATSGSPAMAPTAFTFFWAAIRITPYFINSILEASRSVSFSRPTERRGSLMAADWPDKILAVSRNTR